MKKAAVLKGQAFRVLYLAMSYEGQTFVTGAVDEIRLLKIYQAK